MASRIELSARARCAAGVVVFLAGGLSPFARGEELKSKTPTITVTGVGKISARPDVAEIRVGVTTSAETAQDALSKNNSAMDQLFRTLKERGVPEKDIQTSQVQVTPQYSQPRHPVTPAPNEKEFVPRVVGYRVDNSVTVISHKIESLGPLLDALVQGGANQIHGISFRMNDSSTLLDEARKRAVADARHKAGLLAGEAGVVVGLPLEINDQGSSDPSPPGQYNMGFRVMAAAPMQISPGEQELTASVLIVYELKQPK
jgi:uncharacterized protein